MIGSIVLWPGISIIRAYRSSKQQPPVEQEHTPSVDWLIRKALDWITYESRWGWEQFAKYGRFSKMRTPQELTAKAMAGAIIIQGRPLKNYEFENIQRDYWNTMQFRADDYLDTRDKRPDMPRVRTEPRQVSAARVPNYEEYRVTNEQIISTWPKAKWWYRLWVKWRARRRR